MTYGDILTKFLIEYDKANITSSFPSLTEYEIATVLDKAYLALIAQKVVGTNFRKAPFEGDVKMIEDMRPLISRSICSPKMGIAAADNEKVFTRPSSMLYYLEGTITILENNASAFDEKPHKTQLVELVPHSVANKYRASETNLPWMTNPVCYLERDEIRVLYDSYKAKLNNEIVNVFNATFIKTPAKFLKNNAFDKSTVFELNDSMAEELINMAIIMSLEITESSRLAAKTNTSVLES